MNEVAFVHSNLAPVKESPSLATMQPLAGVNCNNCGNLFAANHANRKYCTEKCRKRSEYKRLVGVADYGQRKCIICGEDFKPRLKNQKCCSENFCQTKSQIIRSRAIGRSKTKVRRSLLIKETPCRHCGNVFIPSNTHSQISYCSRSCKINARGLRRLKRAKKICVVCFCEFETTGIRIYQKTCSKKCKYKHARNLGKSRKTESSSQIKLANGLRSRILKALKAHGCKRADNTMKLIGCSCSELKSHIERLWLPGMTWKNKSYYGWHIDHVIPCASFDLSKPEEQKKCFHFSNLQPLWWIDNLKKNSRTDCSVRLV